MNKKKMPLEESIAIYNYLYRSYALRHAITTNYSPKIYSKDIYILTDIILSHIKPNKINNFNVYSDIIECLLLQYLVDNEKYSYDRSQVDIYANITSIRNRLCGENIFSNCQEAPVQSENKFQYKTKYDELIYKDIVNCDEVRSILQRLCEKSLSSGVSLANITLLNSEIERNTIFDIKTLKSLTPNPFPYKLKPQHGTCNNVIPFPPNEFCFHFEKKYDMGELFEVEPFGLFKKNLHTFFINIDNDTDMLKTLADIEKYISIYIFEYKSSRNLKISKDEFDKYKTHKGIIVDESDYENSYKLRIIALKMWDYVFLDGKKKSKAIDIIFNSGYAYNNIKSCKKLSIEYENCSACEKMNSCRIYLYQHYENTAKCIKELKISAMGKKSK